MNFVSLDFETANHSPVSICAAGLAVFENRLLTDSLYWRVRPPKGHGWFREDFIACLRFTHQDVLHATELLSLVKRLDIPNLTRLNSPDCGKLIQREV